MRPGAHGHLGGEASAGRGCRAATEIRLEDVGLQRWIGLVSSRGQFESMERQRQALRTPRGDAVRRGPPFVNEPQVPHRLGLNLRERLCVVVARLRGLGRQCTVVDRYAVMPGPRESRRRAYRHNRHHRHHDRDRCQSRRAVLRHAQSTRAMRRYSRTETIRWLLTLPPVWPPCGVGKGRSPCGLLPEREVRRRGLLLSSRHAHARYQPRCCATVTAR